MKRDSDVVDGVKTISSSSRNDARKYVCVAINSLGNVSKSFFLSVNDVLQKPTTILTSTNTKGTYISHKVCCLYTSREFSTKIESIFNQYILFSIFKYIK